MNITVAIIFLNGTAISKVESDRLVECDPEGVSGGANIDRTRQLLEQTFGEIHDGDVDVMFPELGECEETEV